MSSQDDLPDYSIEAPNIIPRSPNFLNPPSLVRDGLRNPHQSKIRQPMSFASADESKCNESENSQVLCLAEIPKRSRGSRHSLSLTGNQAPRVMDGPSDPERYAGECSESDNLAWSVIDREIDEWQRVCRTGRLSWWSQESKDRRLGRLSVRISTQSSTQSWMNEFDSRRKDVSSSQRRAVSDSYLTGLNCAEELAHLVAIQLLSSCFTLPPDQIGFPLSRFTSHNLEGPRDCPDPRLISSLRMHTHFRYSPSFGHQAQNTSPVDLWSESCQGPEFPSSPPYLTLGFHTPFISTSVPPSRRRTAHRSRNLARSSGEGRLVNQSVEHSDKSCTTKLDPIASVSTQHLRQANDESKARSTVVLHVPQHRIDCRHCAMSIRPSGDGKRAKSYRGVQSAPHSYSPTTKYGLQREFRSEPHHFFVQPAKDSVVKRWKTFRRRVGGSLYSTPSDSDNFKTQLSSIPPSAASSPALSSDARVRRRRAQQRSHIRSSSGSIPHYNSPASGCGSPDGNDQPRLLRRDLVRPSQRFLLADPQAEPVLAMTAIETPSGSSSSKSLHQPKHSDSLTWHDLASIIIPYSTPEIGPRHRAMPCSSAQSHTNIKRNRQHRASMLSEIQTLEGFAESNAGREACKELTIDSGQSAVERVRAWSKEDLEAPKADTDLVILSKVLKSFEKLGPTRAFSVQRMSSMNNSRLRLSKTSTTGTQIFTPNDNGIEIDGLPAGPSKEEIWGIRWNRTCKRRERTYL